MALIDWSDDLSVKVAEIDKQHQKLITVINELHDAMRSRKTNEVLSKIIQDLFNYTEQHFITEEEYFDKFGYPQAPSHKKEHDVFIAKVLDFKQGLEDSRLFLSTQITDFLKNWLQNHIKGTDKKYSQFFNEKGLK